MVLGHTNHFVALARFKCVDCNSLTECHKPSSNCAHFICTGLKISRRNQVRELNLHPCHHLCSPVCYIYFYTATYNRDKVCLHTWKSPCTAQFVGLDFDTQPCNAATCTWLYNISSIVALFLGTRHFDLVFDCWPGNKILSIWGPTAEIHLLAWFWVWNQM